MREIKFRGQIKETKEWVYGTLLRIPAPPQCIGNKKQDTYFIQFADPRYMPDWNMPYKMVQGEVIPETVGQYTGLKDKNGKEIYEGDIVLYEDWEMATESGSGDMFINKGIVEYNKSNCCFNITERQTVDNPDLLFEDTDCIEVIGNTTDNPKLLEVQNEQ